MVRKRSCFADDLSTLGVSYGLRFFPFKNILHKAFRYTLLLRRDVARGLLLVCGALVRTNLRDDSVRASIFL